MVSLQAAFAILVLSASGQTVLLDFSADWCGPCRAMETSVRSLQEKGYPVQKVNVEQNQALAAQYGVRSLPCFIMLVDGREVDRVQGGTSFSRLEKMCKLASAEQTQNPPFPANKDPNVVPASFQQFPGATTVSAQPWSAQPLSGAGPGSVAEGHSEVSEPIPPGNGGPLDAKLLAASVRLRIEDPNGNSCGSGTIIDARDGEALILTCGHIFRDSQGQGRIDVDMFGPYAGQRIPGRLVSFDLTRDIGLIAIKTPGPIAAVPLAPPSFRTQKGDKVVSVGCDNGKNPAVRYSYVTSLDRYAGPSNLQVAGQPTEGRSGGGLFSANGMLIGVCNARDPQDQEGFYAALDTIRAQLDQSGLAFIYQGPQSQDGLNRSTPMLSVNPPQTTPQISPQTPRTVLPPANGNVLAENMGPPLRNVEAPGAGLNPSEQAAMEEIRRRLKEGAEVVCVIRSRNNFQAKSEVIMIDKASPAFVQQLAAEAQAQQGRQETSLEVPGPRPQPTLQWPPNANNAQGWRSGQ